MMEKVSGRARCLTFLAWETDAQLHYATPFDNPMPYTVGSAWLEQTTTGQTAKAQLGILKKGGSSRVLFPL